MNTKGFSAIFLIISILLFIILIILAVIFISVVQKIPPADLSKQNVFSILLDGFKEFIGSIGNFVGKIKNPFAHLSWSLFY